MQGRNRDTDIENKRMDTKGGKRGSGGSGGGGEMNWEIGIGIYTLICIKWITNKDLLYKKKRMQKKNFYKAQKTKIKEFKLKIKINSIKILIDTK